MLHSNFPDMKVTILQRATANIEQYNLFSTENLFINEKVVNVLVPEQATFVSVIARYSWD